MELQRDVSIRGLGVAASHLREDPLCGMKKR